MKPIDIIELLLLGTLWGGSFLFMRIATPEFGPIALVAVRVFVATLVLLPFLLRAIRRLSTRWQALCTLNNGTHFVRPCRLS